MISVLVGTARTDWSGFWPTLLATFVGVVFAAMAALGTDRIGDWRSERTSSDAARAKQVTALRDLRTVLKLFRDALPVLMSDDGGRVAIGVQWPLPTWKAVAEDLRHLDNTQLRTRLFQVFGQIEQLKQAVEFRQALVIAPSGRGPYEPSAAQRLLGPSMDSIREIAGALPLAALDGEVDAEIARLEAR